MWTSFGRCKQHKADGCNDSPARVASAKAPPPFWLSPIFSRPAHHQCHQARRPKWRDFGRSGSPHAPWRFHFPILHTFHIFSEEREPGSNVRTEHKTWLQRKKERARGGLVACSFGNTGVLEKSWSPVSVETQIKINQRQPEEKGIKSCTYVFMSIDTDIDIDPC